MTGPEKLIATARAEIGYLEKATNSNLDNKTANAGSNNWNKYARDLDMTDLYNGKKNGFHWCDIFVDWCFVKTFGFDTALKLTCQPTKGAGAGCTYSAGYYKNKGQFHTSNPQPGDQIFFTQDNGKTFYHTGIVEKVSGGRVYTIEGNTSSDAGVVSNGGSVNDKSYSLAYNRIGGYGRPDWSIVGDTNTGNSSSSSTNSDVVAPNITYNPNKSGTVTATSLNVRTGPSTSYKAVKIIKNGETVTIVGANTNASWYKIKTSAGTEGWVSASYIKVSGVVESTTSSVIAPTISYNPNKTGTVTATSLNVRTGPGTGYKAIKIIGKNTPVTIVGANADVSWYKIRSSSVSEGWVSAAYIKVN